MNHHQLSVAWSYCHQEFHQQQLNSQQPLTIQRPKEKQLIANIVHQGQIRTLATPQINKKIIKPLANATSCSNSPTSTSKTQSSVNNNGKGWKHSLTSDYANLRKQGAQLTLKEDDKGKQHTLLEMTASSDGFCSRQSEGKPVCTPHPKDQHHNRNTSHQPPQHKPLKNQHPAHNLQINSSYYLITSMTPFKR